jgi:hypothetical protein
VDQIEVYPQKDKWYWRRREGKSIAAKCRASGYADRAEAIAEARKERGGEVNLVDDDGKKVGRASLGGLRVVLLRADGSEYGELDAPASSSNGQAQRVTLTPAGETSKAVGRG